MILVVHIGVGFTCQMGGCTRGRVLVLGSSQPCSLSSALGRFLFKFWYCDIDNLSICSFLFHFRHPCAMWFSKIWHVPGFSGLWRFRAEMSFRGGGGANSPCLTLTMWHWSADILDICTSGFKMSCFSKIYFCFWWCEPAFVQKSTSRYWLLFFLHLITIVVLIFQAKNSR